MEKKMNHLLRLAENQYLETERLLLRPMTLDDGEDMFEYASDEETVAYVFPLHQNVDETRAVIADYFIREPLGKYALELKADGKMIGSIDLRVDATNNIAEIGYTLGRAFWGQGLMPEAGQALVQLGFEVLKLNRIFANYDIDNPNSGKVMEKLGMKEEGRIHNARIAKGKIVTDVLMGITIEDWKVQQKLKKIGESYGMER